MINLNSCGDSTPRYAIYQLDKNLTYRKIGTWSNDNSNSRLKLNRNVIDLQERKEEKVHPGVLGNSTQCLPTCVNPDKPIKLQRVRKQRNVYCGIINDLL